MDRAATADSHRRSAVGGQARRLALLFETDDDLTASVLQPLASDSVTSDPADLELLVGQVDNLLGGLADGS